MRTTHQLLTAVRAMQAAVEVAYQQQCIFLVLVGVQATHIVGCSNVVMTRPTYADSKAAVMAGPKAVARVAQATHHVEQNSSRWALRASQDSSANSYTAMDSIKALARFAYAILTVPP